MAGGGPVWFVSGTKSTHITHNWCDKTTWYSNATRVVDEVATVDTPYTVYKITANRVMIDSYHGKITGEDHIVDSSGNSFRVVVKVNDVTKTERDPHVGSGGDYTVDYLNGKVTFTSALQSGDVVKITYHYAGNSEYLITPAVAKSILIHQVEAQFTDDVVVNDSVVFQLKVAGNPYGNPSVYKTMQDFVNEANGVFPSIPIIGGAGWRGSPKAIYTFPWNYIAMTEIKSSLAMSVSVKLQHDVPFGGTSATATFYCTSQDE